jgi:hypothetical protein
LCTQNLPTPTIGATSTTQANDYFNAILWSGNNSYPRALTGVGFAPDLVWAKSRTNAYSHVLYDSVRGTGTSKSLYSNETSAEGTNSANANLTSFDADGFTIGSTSSTNILNANANTFVAWNWNAGGSNATNTSGTITSTVRANTTAGFSVVTWAASGTNPTIGHGLGAAPSLIIAKSRNNAGYGWAVYHKSLGRSKFLSLDATTAETSYTNYWGTSDPTSTVFGTSDGSYNNNIGNMVAYCFAPVAGYSAFGTYTSNNSTDGPFIYLGFRPEYILIKSSSKATEWLIKDAVRDPYNAGVTRIYANQSGAETATGGDIDYLSNGFKIRTNTSEINNDTGSTFIYAAFAEHPFKYSLAR